MVHAGMHDMIMHGMHNHGLTCSCFATFLLQFKVQLAYVGMQILHIGAATTAACDAGYIPACLSVLQEKLDWAEQALDLLFALRPHMTSSSMWQISHLHGVKLIGDLLLPQTEAMYQNRQQGSTCMTTFSAVTVNP